MSQYSSEPGVKPSEPAVAEQVENATTERIESETANKAPVKHIKWKPLMIDTPKRERKPYKGGSRAHRSDLNGEEGLIPPHASNKRNYRTKSLDRQQEANINGESVNEEAANTSGVDSSKKEDPQGQSTLVAGETSNRTRPAKQSGNKSASKLNKSLNDATTSQHQRNHSSSSQAKSGEQSGRPLKFERATAAAKAYRNTLNPLKSKRDNHKEFLYGQEAIIVEELPLIVPNGLNYVISAHNSAGLMHPIEQSLMGLSLGGSNDLTMFYNEPLYTEEQVKELVRRQIEYYFSEENLERDLFLRGKMDVLGYIPLSVIASFNRVKSLSQNFELIVNALCMSETLELTPVYDAPTGKLIENYLVRCSQNPAKWTLHNLSGVPGLPHLNPNVAEFVPRFSTNEEDEVVETPLEESAGGKTSPVAISCPKRPNLDRMLSSSAPEKDNSQWFTVLSNKELLLKKKQSKKQFTSVNKTQKSQLSEKSKPVKTGASNDNREELDFMFDEEIDNGGKKNSNKMNSTAIFSDSSSESDEDCDEMDDQAISKLVIITQSPPANRKQSSGDSRFPRAKITSDWAKAINDGLFYYEQDLMNSTSSRVEKQPDSISQEESTSQEAAQGFSKKPAAANTFVPHSLPNDSITPSFRHLMSHVNAIKSGTIQNKHAKAASNAMRNPANKLDTSNSNGKNDNRRDSCSNVLGEVEEVKMVKSRRINERYSGINPSANSRFYPVVKDAKSAEPGAPFKRRTRHSQNPPVESHVGWVMDNRRQANKSRSRQNSLNFGAKQYTSATATALNSASTGITPIDDSYANLSSSYSQSQDLQPFHHPSYTLLHQNGFTQQLYGKFRKRCLNGLKQTLFIKSF